MSDKSKILNENLYGVHKEMIKKHHAFEKCLHQAMQSYTNQELKNVLEDIREEMCGVSQEYHKELLEDALTHLKQNKR